MTTGFAIMPLALAALLAAQAAAAQGSAIADAQPGAVVTVTGTVERMLDDDEFRLVDATGALPVYVGPNPMPVAVGEQVTVTGRMDDDGPRELYAREIVRADGTTVALAQDE